MRTFVQGEIMLNLRLDAQLARVTLKPSLGHWQIVDEGKTWADFQAGSVTACRKVRRGGKTYWVTVVRIEADPLAALLHNALGGRSKPMYPHFSLYRVNPRKAGADDARNVGGSMVHRLSPIIQEAGW
jgi:hypothetical protein